jgi:hypothetical protein
MGKIIVIASFQFLFFFTRSWAQDTVVVRPCRLIGDTLFLLDKVKYGLLPEISNSEFVYGRYLTVKSKVMVKARLKDGSDLIVPYSFESLFSDGQKINFKYTLTKKEKTVVVNAKAPRENTNIFQRKAGRRQLKLTDEDNNRTYKFSQGDKIYFRLISEGNQMNIAFGGKVYKNSLLAEGRIVKILDGVTPSVKIRMNDFGKTEKIIPLSDFKQISNFNLNNFITSKIFAGFLLLESVLFFVFPLEIKPLEPTPFIIIGAGLGFFGVKKLIKMKHTFDMTQNSTITII